MPIVQLKLIAAGPLTNTMNEHRPSSIHDRPLAPHGRGGGPIWPCAKGASAYLLLTPRCCTAVCLAQHRAPPLPSKIRPAAHCAAPVVTPADHRHRGTSAATYVQSVCMCSVRRRPATHTVATALFPFTGIARPALVGRCRLP